MGRIADKHTAGHQRSQSPTPAETLRAGKKTTGLTIVDVLQQVVAEQTRQLQQSAALPHGIRLEFDPQQETVPTTADAAVGHCGDEGHHTTSASRVQKTTQRTVVTLQHGCCQVRETIREQTSDQGEATVIHSSELAEMVPVGGKYGFDLIAYVGTETYLHGRALEDVQQALAERTPPLPVPLSSLWDQQQKFLYLLGRLHRRAAPRLREYLSGQPSVTWLLDGTLEPETPVFLGIQDAVSGMFLDAWKIPSENADDVAKCLCEAAQQYGRPHGVLHDLSPAMVEACEAALPGVPHWVCHFHLARDVGNDLCGVAQTALVKRQRSLKTQARLREQRRGQTEWLRSRRQDPGHALVLRRLLAGEDMGDVNFSGMLGREVLLAFHFWIMDDRQDGHRRGIPFDPYPLYLHRRLVRAGEAVDRLLSVSEVSGQSPPVLRNFRKLLAEYRADGEIARTASAYERAFAMFGRLREALKLSADQMRNLRQPYTLPGSECARLQTALHDLRESLRGEVEGASDGLAATVLSHLDKYWSYLVPDSAVGSSWERTTNKLESRWSVGKRNRRQSHGRGKLTRDFQSLPSESMLVSNLGNATYLELVLGGCATSLGRELSLSSEGAGTFSSWRRGGCEGLLGQPTRRQLREPEFLPNLQEVCENQCRPASVA